MSTFDALLAVARAHVNIYFCGDPVREHTDREYRRAYGRYRAGLTKDDSPATAVWRRSAIRYGAHAHMRELIGELETAMAKGDGAAAEEIAAAITGCLDTIAQHPQGRMGGRRRWPKKADTAVSASAPSI